MAQRVKLTKEQRAAKINEAKDTLKEGVSQILTDKDFLVYLNMMSRFHKYSVGNVMMILRQKPDATLVAGYNRWLKMGRKVMKGEKGIKIIAPRTGKKEGADGEEKFYMTFGVEHVFDLSQTEGDPLPEKPEYADSYIDVRAEGGLETAFQEFVQMSHKLWGCPVKYQTLAEGTHGQYSRNLMEITMSTLVPTDSINAIRVLVHEIAHHLTHSNFSVLDKPKEPMTYAESEAIAEGTAYIVGQYIGIGDGSGSFPYIANWVQSHELFMSTMEKIRAVSNQIIAAWDMLGVQSDEDQVAA